MEGITDGRDLKHMKHRLVRLKHKRTATSNAAQFYISPPFSGQLFLSHSLYSHTIYEEEKKKNLLVFCVFLYPDIVHYT